MSVAERRFQTSLVMLFGLVAALLASLGIYGVMSYSVAQRTGELGIRMALGALPAGMRWLVLRQCLVPVAAGLACGLVASGIDGPAPEQPAVRRARRRSGDDDGRGPRLVGDRRGGGVHPGAACHARRSRCRAAARNDAAVRGTRATRRGSAVAAGWQRRSQVQQRSQRVFESRTSRFTSSQATSTPVRSPCRAACSSARAAS